jgi:hypothetical protein
VCNTCIYRDQFWLMIIGGPNNRKDFHEQAISGRTSGAFSFLLTPVSRTARNGFTWSRAT